MLPTLMLAPPQLPAVSGATGPHLRPYLPVASAGPPPSSYAALYPVAPPNGTAPTLPVLTLAPPKKTRSKYETGYYRSVFAERPPRPLSSSTAAAAAAAPPPQPTVKNWNADFQSIISELSTAEEEEEKLRLYNRLSHLAHDFVYVAKTYGKIIIMERCLPHEAKTIKPVRRAALVTWWSEVTRVTSGVSCAGLCVIVGWSRSERLNTHAHTQTGIYTLRDTSPLLRAVYVCVCVFKSLFSHN